MTDSTSLNDALASNYLLVSFALRSYSGKVTDKTASNEVIANKGATRDSGKFVKNLLAGADGELKAVNQLGTALRGFVYSRTVPWSNSTDGAKRGDRLIAATESIEFLRELNLIKKDYDSAVLRLQTVWDQRIKEALGNLGGLGNSTEYLDAADVPSKFSVSVDLLPVPQLSDFSRINVPVELASAMGQRHMQLEEIKVQNAKDDLRQRMLEEIQRMATQLKKCAAGEKTRLYDSLVTNLQDLVRLARSMNMTGNSKFTELADRIESELLKYPVDVYRNHHEKAGVVADAAASLAVDAAIEDFWK
jgi:hypothetical protein